MLRWVTSDLHFYHKRIMDHCPFTRPYKDWEEMNECLISHWNTVVGDKDTIYHIGDFSFRGKEATKYILEKLNGNKVFILGNHDYKLQSVLAEHGEVYHYKEISCDGIKVVLFHYPIASFNGQHRGSVALHGHCHGNYTHPGRSIDVGWDAQGRIMSLEEAVTIAWGKGSYSEDHHWG